MKIMNNKQMLAEFLANNEPQEESSDSESVGFKALGGISDDSDSAESEASQMQKRLDLKTEEGFYAALKQQLSSAKKQRTNSAL